MISDLSEALTLVPSTWERIPKGAVTKLTIKKMLLNSLISVRGYPQMWRIGTGAQRLSDNFDPLKEFMVCIQNARRRAKKLQIDCELTDEFSKAIWLRCQGSCEVTGIQFNFNWNFGSSSRRPFAPSIDRIDSRFGYTEGNVRVVCVAVNLAMNDWGESVLQIIAKALVNKNSLKIKKDTQP